MDPEDENKIASLDKRLAEAKEKPDMQSNISLLSDLNELWRKYLMNKLVWFMIYEQYGKYKIAIFYENKLNMPNGEDL